MYVLGIEAATPVAGVAVVNEEKVLAERFINNKRTHSVNLLPMIKEVIVDAGIKKEEINGIAVSAGPGSFTGLRIGMTTAKTLAQVWGIPIIAVSTLDAMSFPLIGYHGLVCPILNARKNEVYSAIYQGGATEIKRLAPPMAVPMSELLQQLSPWPDKKVLFLGDAIDIYREQLKSHLGAKAQFAANAAVLPRGATVAELGLVKLNLGEVSSPLEIKPNYIRPSEAEVKWAEKHKGSGERGCGN
ncbi:tRNA (adenosine(37)-N6)-threonylcarbamoyltransferase complex dimerization subunit type 1 TsaB [Peptococcaceae bacterium 1198_IL3148]